MSSKFEYSDEMVTKMKSAASGGLTEEVIQNFVNEFEFPRRSVTAKYRKLGFEVPTLPKAAPVFSADETAALKAFLASNKGQLTSEEVAAKFEGGKFNARQINGKALSLELSDHLKPAEKKETVKTFTDAETAVVVKMAEAGAFLEDIVAALPGKDVPQVRGKLLSLKLKAPQKNKKETTAKDTYAGIESLAKNMTVAELAERFGKTERGVKTVLTRRGVSAKDYTPSAKE